KSENMSAKTNENNKKLVRGLSLLDATMIVVGSMIGSGIFIVSAESARLVGAPGWLLVAWLLAGIMTITGALCFGELAAAMPKAGGPYVFMSEAYGKPVGFLYGWSQFLIVQSGTIAAVAVAFANFTGILLPYFSGANYLIEPVVFGSYAVGLSTQQLLAIASIVLLTFINTRGLEVGKWIQNTFTITKTAALLGLVIIGLLFGWNSGGALFSADLWNSSANGWSLETAQPAAAALGSLAFVIVLGKAMTGPLFSQSAWDNVTFTGAEVENPGRNLPRALIIGCGIVVSLYLLANLAYVVTLSLPALQNAPNGRVATAVMEQILGTPGVILIAVALMISTFGCNNGLILSGSRVSYAMAKDGFLFAPLAKTNDKHVPAFALLAQCVWACLLILPRTVTYAPGNPAPVFGNVYTQLLEYIVSVDLISAALSVLAVIVLRRRKPEMARPYRTWGYPITPLIFLSLSMFVTLTLLYLSPGTAGIGYLLALTGIPVYFIWRNRSKQLYEPEAQR
ncbi:MAG TPA: amino acid permease, partial [Pyrinomonadaceae bacterium]|nr:amino acid permease [Pyrinomonadaceae bacterium]